MTIKDVMIEIGMGNVTYDTAYPHEWGQRLINAGLPAEELRNYVWVYDEQSRIYGRPFNYMAAYARHLIKQQEDGFLQLVQAAEDKPERNLMIEAFNMDAIKKKIADCPADEIVILCPHWSINKPKYGDGIDPETEQWDWDDFEKALDTTIMVNDYDDLIADPHGIMNM